MNRRTKKTCTRCGAPADPAGSRVDGRITAGGRSVAWSGRLCPTCAENAMRQPDAALRALLAARV